MTTPYTPEELAEEWPETRLKNVDKSRIYATAEALQQARLRIQAYATDHDEAVTERDEWKKLALKAEREHLETLRAFRLSAERIAELEAQLEYANDLLENYK